MSIQKTKLYISNSQTEGEREPGHLFNVYTDLTELEGTPVGLVTAKMESFQKILLVKLTYRKLEVINSPKSSTRVISQH